MVEAEDLYCILWSLGAVALLKFLVLYLEITLPEGSKVNFKNTLQWQAALQCSTRSQRMWCTQDTRDTQGHCLLNRERNTFFNAHMKVRLVFYKFTCILQLLCGVFLRLGKHALMGWGLFHLKWLLFSSSIFLICAEQHTEAWGFISSLPVFLLWIVNSTGAEWWRGSASHNVVVHHWCSINM